MPDRRSETSEDILAAGSIVHSLCYDDDFWPLVTISETAAMAGWRVELAEYQGE